MRKNNIDIKKIIVEGGATLNKYGEDFVSNEGFMVSVFGAEFKTTDEEKAKSKIEEYLKKIQTEKGLFVGVWVDEGEVYVDLSIHIMDYLEALEIARDNDQLAIYDLKNNDSIYLNYVKYYTLYRVIKNKDNEVIDYKLIKQYDRKEEIKEELKASKKTIDNIIYKSFRQYEKRLKDFQNYILISDKITLEEVTA